MEDKPDPNDSRTTIDQALRNVLSPARVELVVDQILQSKKQVWMNCPSCKKRNLLEVDDAKAVASGLSELITQAQGRPGTESPGDGSLVVNRKVVLVADPDSTEETVLMDSSVVREARAEPEAKP